MSFSAAPRAPLVVRLPTLHRDQERAWEALDARFAAVRCGRRWGKSELGLTVACSDLVHGGNVGWFGPDYKRTTPIYPRVKDMMRALEKTSDKGRGEWRGTNGAEFDIWTLGGPTGEDAGRGRKYTTVIVDEAAFVKKIGTVKPLDIWNKAIKPTLLDYKGKALFLSNTAGVDPENLFYQVCSQPEHGFVEYHAPSINNPLLNGGNPAEEIERLRISEHPLVFLQEYEAEFVDWSGVAFFALDKWLEAGEPVSELPRIDAVYAVVDSATKTGAANDGTGAVYFGLCRPRGPGLPRLYILDWDYAQIEGALLETWLPTVFQNLEALAALHKCSAGSMGAWIEDKNSGSVLLQQCARRGWPARECPQDLTAVGKSERAIGISGYHYRGEVKITRAALEKTVTYKGSTQNHLRSQVVGFRVGDEDKKKDDDLLDCYAYGVALGLGNYEGH